jgi:hypothetical protein
MTLAANSWGRRGSGVGVGFGLGVDRVSGRDPEYELPPLPADPREPLKEARPDDVPAQTPHVPPDPHQAQREQFVQAVQ